MNRQIDLSNMYQSFIPDIHPLKYTLLFSGFHWYPRGCWTGRRIWNVGELNVIHFKIIQNIKELNLTTFKPEIGTWVIGAGEGVNRGTRFRRSANLFTPCTNPQLSLFCFTTLCDWLTELALPSQSIRCKTQTNRDLAMHFYNGSVFVSCVKFLKCPTMISYQGNSGPLGPRGDVGLPGTDVSYLYLRSFFLFFFGAFPHFNERINNSMCNILPNATLTSLLLVSKKKLHFDCPRQSTRNQMERCQKHININQEPY